MENDFRKDLIVKKLEAMQNEESSRLVDLIVAANLEGAFDRIYGGIFPMSRFNDILHNFSALDVALMTKGKELDKGYFTLCGADPFAFHLFDWDELNKVFPFEQIADLAITSDTFRPYELEHIVELPIWKLRRDVYDILSVDIGEMIEAYNSYVIDTVGCNYQIFPMDDLQIVWFDACNGDFNEALSQLVRAHDSGDFNLDDRWYEMSDDRTDELHSFSDIADSDNFYKYRESYIDNIIIDRDFTDLPEQIVNELNALFTAYNI